MFQEIDTAGSRYFETGDFVQENLWLYGGYRRTTDLRSATYYSSTDSYRKTISARKLTAQRENEQSGRSRG